MEDLHHLDNEKCHHSIIKKKTLKKLLIEQDLR